MESEKNDFLNIWLFQGITLEVEVENPSLDSTEFLDINVCINNQH